MENHRPTTPSPALHALLSLAVTGCLGLGACGGVPPDDGPPVATAVSAEIERQLDARYPAAAIRHRFTTEIGDGIECVDRDQQPALRDPRLAGQPLQLRPASLPSDERSVPGATARPASPDAHALAFFGRGLDESGAERRCPEGTIPVLRHRADQLRHFESLEDFHSKYPHRLGGDAAAALALQRSRAPRTVDGGGGGGGEEDPLRIGSTMRHQHAIADQWVTNFGAETRLNVWNPYIEGADEFSLSQMWVVNGSGGGTQTVEAGWQNYPLRYGDARSRLFIFYTADNYHTNKCYNLDCTAFVQVSNAVTLGGAFNPVSTRDGAQYEFKLLWYKDGINGHWWLRFGDTWIGYYPRSIFATYGHWGPYTLGTFGDYVGFGGEIINDNNGRHTMTAMGGGGFAASGFGRAAWQRTLLYVDTSSYYQTPSLVPRATDWSCYDVSLASDPGGWGSYIYFGGPGYNVNCM